jgi:hypothetical protein
MIGGGARLLAGVAIGALAACTPMRYERAGATDSERAADMRDCGDLAYAEALRTPYYYSPASRLSPRAPVFDLHVSRFAYFDDPSYWRWAHERDLVDFCLRARGWRLTPVEKPKPAG